MADRVVKVVLRGDVSHLNRALLTAGGSAKTLAGSLDTADSRMSNIVQTALALGPALIPIGAAAVPAVAGLATQLGAAAGAAGVSILAFQGVGSALDALNKAQLEPTAENIEKARQAFEEIGPAAQQFVVFLDEIQPQLERLQTAASNGLLPGVQEGISELLELGPQARDIITELADTSGDLFAEAGDNLNDARWREFFAFLEAEARPTLLDLGRTAGNVFEGIADLMMATNPLADDFSDGLLDASRDFADWADGLSRTQGFQEFVDYIQRNGPQAVDTLGAIANAGLQLVQAAAPVGEVALPAIEGIANALAAVAESPAGPALITLAAGLSAVSRAMAIGKAANASALVGLLGGVSKNMSKTEQSARRMDAGLRAGAAGLGVLALSLTDVDDKMGLSNTAMFAMMGAIAGPWGAAVGAGVGLAMDFASANDDLADALERAGEAAQSPFGFEEQRQAIRGIRAEVGALEARYQSSVGTLTAALNPFNDIPARLKIIYGDALGELERAEDKALDLKQSLQDNQVALADFYHELRTGRPSESTADIIDDLERIDEIAAELGPILDELGIDPKVITDPTRKGWDEAIDAIGDYMAAQDSVQGRTRGVAAAFADLESRLASSADKADALSTALDELLGVELDQAEATDAWHEALNNLDHDLAQNTRSLKGNTNGAIQNRRAIRDRVENLQAMIEADARAGVGPEKLAAKLQTSRQALLRAADAAGLNRKQVAQLINTYGLTPDLVQTIFRALGISRAEQETRNLRDRYNALPKNVRTELRALGGDISRADVKRLQREYDLTPKEVRTILEAVDRAGGKIDFVKAKLQDLDGSEANPSADLNDRASGSISTIASKLNSLDGQIARTTVVNTTVNRTVSVVEGRNGTPIRLPASADGNLFEFADGGGLPPIGAQRPQIQPNRGPRGIMWAETGAGPWEAFISGHPAKRDRSLDIWRQVGDRLGVQFREFAEGGILQRFADGGFVGGARPITTGYLQDRLSAIENPATLREYNRALRERARRLRDVRRERRQLRRERKQARDATRDLARAERDLDKAQSALSSAEGRKERARAREALEQARNRVRRLRDRERTQTRQAERAEKDLTKAKDRHAKAQDRVTEAVRDYSDAQREAIQAAEAFASGILDTGSLFGGETLPTIADQLGRMDFAAEQAEQFRRLRNRLERRGLAEGLLDQFEAEGASERSIELAQQILAEDKIAEFNKSFAALVDVANRVGAQSAAPAPEVNRNVVYNIITRKVDGGSIRQFERAEALRERRGRRR